MKKVTGQRRVLRDDQQFRIREETGSRGKQLLISENSSRFFKYIYKPFS